MFYIADEKKQKSALLQAVYPKIVTDGLVSPRLQQRNAAARPATSVKLCNKRNSWAASTMTVTDLGGWGASVASCGCDKIWCFCMRQNAAPYFP